ncbi:MAG: HAMP domain-containing histidine kinase [Bacteroidetes bacterium]|nr:MAG: HAMP domain-containing histidine kinase [Bacteroidota bacterium]
MKAYRVSVNLKWGLLIFAVSIAFTSLWYTNDLVHRLRQQETAIATLWGKSIQEVFRVAEESAVNPYQNEFRYLESAFDRSGAETPLTRLYSDGLVDDFRRAMSWARTMPSSGDLDFIYSTFLEPNAFNIPAILVDSSVGMPTSWWNVDVEYQSYSEVDSLSKVDTLAYKKIRDELTDIALKMGERNDPILISVTYPIEGRDEPLRLVQTLYYGESALVQTLRWFPYIQLGFVALFVGVAYIGFSYIRRSEQSSLWVGMAKEAAHQLGTPISSLMGWLEVLRLNDNSEGPENPAYAEIEQDIHRLSRVTSRFSDIGSMPRLESQSLDLVIGSVCEYMQARFPQQAGGVTLEVNVDPTIVLPLNADLFEWVIENLIKNALDALEGESGAIRISGSRENGNAVIDIQDSGKGIDRRNHKNIFKPGYSTKKRGWGLGLSLAQRIIREYHGGQLVLASSKPGQGTVFRITLPSVEEAGQS